MTVTEESPYVWVDAEIEQRLNLLVSWARTAGENSTEEVTDTELALRAAFRDVFRVVNAQREAAVREALESVREWVVESGVYTFVIAHIDAMLAKEDGDE